MKQKIFSAVFCISFLSFFFVPSFASASSSIRQTVTKLNENTFLFTVTYPFSFLGYGAAMPIGAVQGLRYEQPSPYVGYELLNEDGTPVMGAKSAALVLSGAPFSERGYEVLPGKQADFMLMALVTLPAGNDPKGTYLQVTKLPFTLLKGNTILPSQLDETQLKSYRTSSVQN
jgi:hypothetical protein